MTLFHSSYWPVLGSTSSPHTMVLIGHISCNLPTKMNQNLTLILSATTWFQFIQPWTVRQHVPSKCQCQPVTLYGIKTHETRAWTIPHHETLQTYNTNWLCSIQLLTTKITGSTQLSYIICAWRCVRQSKCTKLKLQTCMSWGRGGVCSRSHPSCQ